MRGGCRHKARLHQSCVSSDSAQGSEQQDPATVPEGGPAAEIPIKAESENTESSEPGNVAPNQKEETQNEGTSSGEMWLSRCYGTRQEI